uniref:Uncharacterized protein n=1 Tax=Ciona intestinalis TaxID=7719 RepID=H2XYV8_CIOIN
MIRPSFLLNRFCWRLSKRLKNSKIKISARISRENKYNKRKYTFYLPKYRQVR